MAGRDTWAHEFAEKRKTQIARTKAEAEIEADRLEEQSNRETPIIADQVFQGTTLSQRAAEGDPASRKALLGTTNTEPNPETGQYEVTVGELGKGIGSELPSEGEFEAGHEPEGDTEGDGATVEGTLEDLAEAERDEEEKAGEAGDY